MIGLVIITHGRLGEAFVDTLTQITGKSHAIKCISLSPEDDSQHKLLEIQQAIIAVKKDSGVIILTDLFGGTPSNLALSSLKANHVEVIAGVNLPMLIQLVSLPDHVSLRTAVLLAQDAGRKQIQVPSEFLGTSVANDIIDEESSLPAL
jgi:mannose PTS system EIIA component